MAMPRSKSPNGIVAANGSLAQMMSHPILPHVANALTARCIEETENVKM